MTAKVTAEPVPHQLHHMTLYACEKESFLGSPVNGTGEFFDCSGTQGRTNRQEPFPSYDTCGIGNLVVVMVYTVDQDGKREVQYPAGTGFAVGADSGFTALVMRTHYPRLNMLREGRTHHASLVVSLSPIGEDTSQWKQLWSYVGQGHGVIAPLSVQSVADSFYLPNRPVLPVAFTMHTHGFMIQIMLKISTEDGKRVQLERAYGREGAEMYHSIWDTVTLEPRSRLEFECMYNNTLTVPVPVT